MNDYIYELEIAKRYINRGLPYNSYDLYSIRRSELKNYVDLGKGGRKIGNQYLFNRFDITKFRLRIFINLSLDYLLSVLITLLTVFYAVVVLFVFGG